jgi:hypothetical protein
MLGVGVFGNRHAAGANISPRHGCATLDRPMHAGGEQNRKLAEHEGVTA